MTPPVAAPGRPAPVGASAPAAAPEPLEFELPADLEAVAPPEARGAADRGDVRLMVAEKAAATLEHRRFRDLAELLRPGDALVVNTSATVPAALEAAVGAAPAAVHVSAQPAPGHWVVELRRVEGGATAPWLDAGAGTSVELPAGGRLRLVRPAVSAATGAVRLWEAEVDIAAPTLEYLADHGRPVRYRYVRDEFPIAAYQTVFADEPGSAEMPSAARPFTAELVTRLVTRGVAVVPVLLHTGVSSPEVHEPPAPELVRVCADSAARINAARRTGGRIVAVGTTAVRAVETAATARGVVLPTTGWTTVVIGPDRPVRAVDGIITGWHEPRASHLSMLEAIAGRALLEASYRAALEEGYLWHEFGDSHLILP